MNKILILVVISVAYAVASPAEQCEGQNTDGLQERIHVDPCGEQRCDLVKGTNTTVTFRFKTKKVINDLINDVFAKLGPLPLPFIGIHGASACNNIVHAEDNSPAKCPLEANKEYIYVNAFFMESFYPVTTIRVYWALKDGDKSVICFEIPASIINKKKKKKNKH